MDLKLIKQAVSNFLNDEEGASAIEYALIAALIAVAIIATTDEVGQAIVRVFESVRDKLPAAPQ